MIRELTHRFEEDSSKRETSENDGKGINETSEHVCTHGRI